MKREILDIRTYVTIILVIVTLSGDKLSTLIQQKPGAQNLNFIHSHTEFVSNMK